MAEAYPFRPGDNFLLTVDNHNSVNGIRVFAGEKGAKVTYLPVRHHDLRVDEARTGETSRSNPTRWPESIRISGTIELLWGAASIALDRQSS